MAKKRFFSNHSKSSAMVVSLAIHAIIVVVALSFVAVKVMVPQDPTFEAKRVKRPKMPPKKIRVPVNTKKRKPKPRLRHRIVTQKRTFNDIKMPEITGVKGGLGNMGGDGLGSLGFDFKMDLFGGNKYSGNELTGTFFDLKQTKDGKPVKMNDEEYVKIVRNFAGSWKLSRLKNFFQAPKQKYATFFAIPAMRAVAAPKAYGVDDVVKPRHWVAYYKGTISAPETGSYRFCGFGDDVLLVRVKRRLILDASYPSWEGKFTDWHSRDKNNRRYPMAGQHMVIGDWIKLTKGEPKEIEIFFGECPGGTFSCQLAIEQKGKSYPQAPYTYTENGETITGSRPILPIFKTKEIPEKLIGQMRIRPTELTTKGPVFGVQKK